MESQNHTPGCQEAWAHGLPQHGLQGPLCHHGNSLAPKQLPVTQGMRCHFTQPRANSHHSSENKLARFLWILFPIFIYLFIARLDTEPRPCAARPASALELHPQPLLPILTVRRPRQGRAQLPRAAAALWLNCAFASCSGGPPALLQSEGHVHHEQIAQS